MGIETIEATKITCDNPACPGTDLDPADRAGWLLVTSEISGETLEQHVFCGFKCAAVAGQARATEIADAAVAARAAAPVKP